MDPAITGVSTAWGDYDMFWTTTAGGDSNRFNISVNSSHGLGMDFRDPYGNITGLCGTGANTVPDGVWTFVAIVKSGNTFSIYLNGATTPNCTAVSGSTNYPTSSGWTINGRYLSNNNPGQYVGLIDEVRLSDVALSPSQFLDASPSTNSPEPGSLALLGTGMLLFAGLLHRKTRG